MPLSNDLPTQVPLMSATDSSHINSNIDREIVKVNTTAGPQAIDRDFLTQLLTRKDVIPARKRRDFIPNDMKDDHYWERRRKNNLAAKRSREKRRLNDIVLGTFPLSIIFLFQHFLFLLETKVMELTNENEALRAKLHLMLSRLNMKEIDMETLFEEEQRLGHICLKPATSVSTIFNHHDDDDDEHSMMHKDYSSSETHDDDESNTMVSKPWHKNSNDTAVDLSRTEVKTGNLLTTIPSKSPSPLTPSPSPSNESLLQVLANQILKNKVQEPINPSRLLTIASPTDQTNHKRNLHQFQEDNEHQQKWDEAAMTLLSLNKPSLPPPAAPVEQQAAALQSVINGLLRKPNPPKATIDYHSQPNCQQGENFHHQTSFDQWKTLLNYFTMPNNPQPPTHSQSQSSQAEPRADMMPLKLRMKMLNART